MHILDQRYFYSSKYMYCNEVCSVGPDVIVCDFCAKIDFLLKSIDTLFFA